MMGDRFVRSDVEVAGGGYIAFSVGVRECADSRSVASVTVLFERPGQYHSEHREEVVSVDPRIAVEVCLTYCLDSLTSAFCGEVPDEVVDAMTLMQATVRGMCSKWDDMEEDSSS